jgi:hypothetical protein
MPMKWWLAGAVWLVLFALLAAGPAVDEWIRVVESSLGRIAVIVWPSQGVVR